MSSNPTLHQWQDGYFDFMKKVEEPVVQYTGKMADAVAKYVPARPAFMASMPTADELMDDGLKFRRRMVDEQAKFVRQMMKAMHPVLVRFDAAPTADAPMAKPAMAKKPATRQQTTRRPAARRAMHSAA